jgi:oxygen-independent coproporphyrinogen III oxidase
LDLAAVRRYLEEHKTVQPGTKIQYGHPSPRFWTPLAMDVARVAELRRRDRQLFLYLHIPFCPRTDPPACGFCLFAREDYTGHPAVVKYLEYLNRELEMYAPHFAGETIECVYFGGGTPNVLRARDYEGVMASVKKLFTLAPNCEVTLEGVPQLFDKERIHAMAEAGITRISVGAQQLKDELLKYSGRQQTADQVLETIEISHALDLSVNVDLICGWFDQTEQDLEDDLKQLVPLKPESIVVHPLTLQGPSTFAQQKAHLPATRETMATFLRGRQFLVDNGYWGSSYTDYMLANPPRGPRETKYLRFYRELLGYDRLGVGYGANSLFGGTTGAPGITWRNIDQTQTYYEAVDKGQLPILEGFQFDAEDLRLLYVLKGLEGTPHLNRHAYREAFGGDLEHDFEPYWQGLRAEGWLETGGDGTYRLVGEAIFYTPMIQRCLSEDRNAELRRGAPPQVRTRNVIQAVATE